MLTWMIVIAAGALIGSGASFIMSGWFFTGGAQTLVGLLLSIAFVRHIRMQGGPPE